MSTPIFCLALRPLHDTARRQALLVDSQPMKPLDITCARLASRESN